MAIACELIAARGLELSLPPVFRKSLSAAGVIDIDTDANYFIFNNLSTSQAVNIRLNSDGDATQASPSDPLSITVEPGQQCNFTIAGHDASGYKLDVR